METTESQKQVETEIVGDPPRKKNQPFRALQYRDYRLLWLGQGVSQIGTMMRLSAIGWQIYILTRDPLQLGIIGVCRVLPLVLFSFVSGPTADAVNRRKLLLVAEVILGLCSLSLALLTMTNMINVWWIYGIIIFSSAVNAFERPAYAALIPALVPRKELASALSLNTLNFQTATIVGPGLGGMVIGLIGVQGAYFFDAASYVAVFASLLFIHYRQAPATGQRISLEAALEGLRFVWGKKILVATMLLDFFATFFGSSRLLLPVIATEVLHTNEFGFGLLSSADAVGAVITSFVMAWLSPGRFKHPGIIVLVAVFFYSFFTVCFGLSTSLPLSLLFLAFIGASDTVSMVLRQTISQLVTPDEMRGRMQSVNMIFFMGGPQLGELEAGTVARLVNVQVSVISGGIACILLVLLVSYSSKQLRHYQFEQ
ncbi:MAG TPA: MFS transporter [Chloroflexia bacterium]|nr:MFS transporter [Chloroflexia bacterium]